MGRTSHSRRIISYGGKLLTAYALLAAFLAAPALAYPWWHPDQKVQPAKAVAAAPADTKTSTVGLPMAITFVRQQRTLPVSQGKFDEKQLTWTVADKEVQWIQTGNQLVDGKPTTHAIMYGHATNAVLGITKNLVPNDQIIITTESGVKLLYTYMTDKLVQPTDVSILSESEPTQLTLITCHGANSEYRRLMQFTFSGVAQ